MWRDEYGDAEWYCAPCWTAGEPFRAQEDAERSRHDLVMDEIWNEWKAAATTRQPNTTQHQ